MARRLAVATVLAVLLIAAPLYALSLKADQPFKRAPRGTSLVALAHRVALPIPARNLYQLADELKLRPPRRISHVVATVSPNYPVGHDDALWVLSEDTNHFFHVHARIVAETPHLYLYAQDGLKVDVAASQRVVNHFEHSIYPTDRSFYGSEWTPGIDGDPHITCLVADLRSSGVGGYYSAEDEYPRTIYRYSNQREMIYMNSGATQPGDATFAQTLAHESQHMIHENMHPHDNAWLNEGMSMLAEQVNHYAPTGEPSAFVSQPDTQLNAWSTDSRLYAHYGAAYLYLSYLYDRFGRGFIHDVVGQRRYTDFELINSVLQKRHIRLSADHVFNQWVIANLVHDHSVAGGVYGYKHLGYKIGDVTTRLDPSTPVTSQVPPYAAQYIAVDLPKDGHPFHLGFWASSTLPVVSSKGAPFWWGNRGDMSDTRMERPVDLSHVHHATLHFQTWYDIEKQYDYGYVAASRDGGKTWDTLHGTLTSNANPTGANYGNGYTGNSKGWRSEMIDLSRYAGRNILLRFEYVTDDEYTGEGMLVKNISIPEIHFRDNFTGWTQRGWIPIMSNAIPSHWVVQLVRWTKHGVDVSRMPVSSSGQGFALVQPNKEGLQKLVVEVHTEGEAKTTVKSQYKLSATAD